MNNTQKAVRIVATLSDGTRIDVTPTEAISLSSVVELHSVIRTVVPSNKKGLAITSATAYGADNKSISLPTVAVTEANTSKEDTTMNEKVKEALEEALEEATARAQKAADDLFGNDNESFFDKEFESVVEEMEQAVEESVKELKGAKAQQYIKNLINAEDKDVYDTLLSSMRGAIHNSRIAVSTRSKMRANLSTIEAKANLVLDNSDASKKAEVLAKLKLMITVVIRKALALLEGTALFVFDATSILGVMITRIACTTARETAYASRSLLSALRYDIIDHVKHS